MNAMQESPGITPPPAPATLEETGLPMTLMRDILIKTVYRRALSLGTDIARALCLPFAQTQQLIDSARGEQLIEVSSMQRGAANSGEIGYQLTEAGRKHALAALALSEYYGPMPVPLNQYEQQVKRQSIRNIRLTRAELQQSMGDLILPPGLMDTLGPAVTSGRSILLYGPPGNGKSSIANGIRDALGDQI